LESVKRIKEREIKRLKEDLGSQKKGIEEKSKKHEEAVRAEVQAVE